MPFPPDDTPPGPSARLADPALDRLALDRAALAAMLRARAGRGGPAPSEAGIPLCPLIDRALPGGALARAALHEVLAADPAAAAGFCALVLARAAAGRGAVLWIAAAPGARPPSLARFGLGPADLVLVRAPRPADALWAMEEGLRCPGIAAALLVLPDADPEPEPDHDSGWSRRLQLAAGTGGATGLVLHPDGARQGLASALTRWRVAALSGNASPLDDPRWQLELLRCRGAGPASWPVTWRPAAETLEVEGADQSDLAEPRPRRAPGRRAC